MNPGVVKSPLKKQSTNNNELNRYKSVETNRPEPQKSLKKSFSKKRKIKKRISAAPETRTSYRVSKADSIKANPYFYLERSSYRSGKEHSYTNKKSKNKAKTNNFDQKPDLFGAFAPKESKIYGL